MHIIIVHIQQLKLHLTKLIKKMKFKYDWMHDTACCFGYPSDSSRTARKRAGALGWAGTATARRRIRMSAGPPAAATDRRHDRHGRPRKGRSWGGVRAGAAAGGSPPASFAGSRVCGAGSVTGASAGREARAPDRQQRAAALAGGHRVGRSSDTTTPSRTGPAGRSCWAADGFARVSGPSGPGRLRHRLGLG